MTGNHENTELTVVPSGEMGVFHLTHDGQYVGTIAQDMDSLTTQKSWGWRLLAVNGIQHEKDLAGSADDLDDALAAAERAFVRSHGSALH